MLIWAQLNLGVGRILPGRATSSSQSKQSDSSTLLFRPMRKYCSRKSKYPNKTQVTHRGNIRTLRREDSMSGLKPGMSNGEASTLTTVMTLDISELQSVGSVWRTGLVDWLIDWQAPHPAISFRCCCCQVSLFCHTCLDYLGSVDYSEG